jgi:cytochrome b subunit of formate dehydrogenase
MKRNPVNAKVYARAIISAILIIVWVLVAISGVILWAAPTGSRSGQVPLLFELTKSDWKEVHLWVAVATILVTIVHIIIDWKALRGVIRYLVSVHRDMLTEPKRD